MEYIIQPENIEKWPLEKHIGVVSKLLADGKNMTVLWSTWEPGASAPEHTHPHEQIGVCFEGEMIFTINRVDYTVHAGEFYHIPSNAPHAERNDSSKAAICSWVILPKSASIGMFSFWYHFSVYHRGFLPMGSCVAMSSTLTIWKIRNHQRQYLLEYIKERLKETGIKRLEIRSTQVMFC